MWVREREIVFTPSSRASSAARPRSSRTGRPPGARSTWNSFQVTPRLMPVPSAFRSCLFGGETRSEAFRAGLACGCNRRSHDLCKRGAESALRSVRSSARCVQSRSRSTPVPINMLITLPWGNFGSHPVFLKCNHQLRTVVPVQRLKIASRWPIKLTGEVYSKFGPTILLTSEFHMPDTLLDDVLYLTALLPEDQTLVLPRLSGVIPDCGAWIRSRSYLAAWNGSFRV